MPLLDPDPPGHEEDSRHRDVCVRKHTFAASNEVAGRCLHCELYVLCMEKEMWRMDAARPDDVLPCCRGTARAG